jgi:hypothetical protein
MFLFDLPDSIFSISTLVHVKRIILGKPSSKVDELRKKLNLEGSYTINGRNGDLWSQIAELEKAHYFELEIKGLENVVLLDGAEQAKLNSNLTWLSLEWDHDEGSCKTPDFRRKPESLYHRNSPWISGYRVQNVSQIDTQSHTSHHIKLIVH